MQNDRNSDSTVKPDKPGREKDLMIFGIILVISAIGIAGFILLQQMNPESPGAIPENQTIEGIFVIEGNGLSDDVGACLENYSINASQIFFIYSDTCTYSNEMKPLVQDLEKKGYKVVWANVKNATIMQIASTCLSEIMRYEGTPEFICPSTNTSVTGAFASADELENFAGGCK